MSEPRAREPGAVSRRDRRASRRDAGSGGRRPSAPPPRSRPPSGSRQVYASGDSPRRSAAPRSSVARHDDASQPMGRHWSAHGLRGVIGIGPCPFSLPVRRSASPATRAPGCARSWRQRRSSPPRTPAGCTGSATTSTSRSPAGCCRYFEGNEVRRTPALLDELRAGQTVLLVTDAGMPTVSDPGYRLVAAAAAAGTCRSPACPGRRPSPRRWPSAACRATGSASRASCRARAASAGPASRVWSLNVVPPCSSRRRTGWPSALADMAAAFGADRRAVVCRELTKTHEEVRRGSLGELAAWAAGGVRGEITVVVAGAPEPDVALSGGELVREVLLREEAGLTRKDAVAAVAQETGVPKREVYDAVAGSGKRDARASLVSGRMPRHILTAVAWPYANGPRHIGHVAGFGVPSDVFSRYQRMAGNNVLMVSGTDEHGTPIQVQADSKEGVTRPRARRPLQPGHRRGPAGLGLTYDLFTRTTTRNHYAVVRRSCSRPCTTTATSSSARSCRRSTRRPARGLPDRYVEGTCPICGYDGARGDQCDNCGNQLDPAGPDQPAVEDQRRDAEVRRDRALLPRPAGVRRGARRVAADPRRTGAPTS